MTSIEFIQDRIAGTIYEACARRARCWYRSGILEMNSIGRTCQLALWHEINGTEPAAPDGPVARAAGGTLASEDRIIDELQAVGFSVDERGRELFDFEGRFRGRCQGVIRGVTREPHLLAIDSVNEMEYRSLGRDGALRRELMDRLQCLMGYSGLRRALWVVENKNSLELRSERIMFEAGLFAELKRKAGHLLAAAEAPSPPAGIGRCPGCPYRPTCGR